jgi:SAM-dependent methyltransferase
VRSIEVDLPDARRVLDFGCGTGWLVGEARSAGVPFRFGVDVSHEALRQGRGERGGVTFVAGDGLHLPFVSGAFDVVIGHVSLPYMDTRRAMREIYRVLAPGGSFLLTAHSFYYTLWRFRQALTRGPAADTAKEVVHMAYLLLNGALNHCGLPQIPFPRRQRFETVHSTRGICRAAQREGFVLLSAEREFRGRIFFAVTGRKPDPAAGAVAASPGWAIYCRLRTQP